MILWVAIAAASAPLVSIAAANVLLGAALLLTLARVRPLRYPPVLVPLGLFAGGTVASWLASGHVAEGLPQIKKFWVWLLALVVFSVVTELKQARWLVLTWCAAASLSGVWSVAQFGMKYQQSESAAAFYRDYVSARTTGAMSHWMTFSGEQMIVAMFAGALLLLTRDRWRWWLGGAFGVMLVAILLNQTRSVWLAVGAGLTYLLGVSRPKLLPLIPVAVAAAYFAGPDAVRQRMESLVRPDAQLDSNQHRIVTFQTGLRMIEARPWLGLGPERIGPEFDRYLAPGTVKPVGFYGHLHNIYLQFAAERGVPVLLALLALIGKAVWDWIQALKQASGLRRALLHGALAAVLAVLVAGLFEHNLGDSEVLMLFLGTLCIGYTAARVEVLGDIAAG